MWPVVVVVPGELVKHCDRVSFVVDQHLVGALRSDAAHESLGVAVRQSGGVSVQPGSAAGCSGRWCCRRTNRMIARQITTIGGAELLVCGVQQGGVVGFGEATPFTLAAAVGPE